MKRIYLNLKRFDVTPEFGGVNRLADPRAWGSAVVDALQDGVTELSDRAHFAAFLPEAHLISATGALKEGSALHVGCQGIHRATTAPGGNFGAFTSLRPASAMVQLGVDSVLIGHCEERNALREVMAAVGVEGTDAAPAVDRLLNEELKRAVDAGLDVLFCIGEREEEADAWHEVIAAQIERGLADVDTSKVALAYEPVWSIGPGKTPAGKEHITRVAELAKERSGGLPVVYGGGLKSDNAEMLASIDAIDGGLIALTRFTGEIGFYPEEYFEIVRLYLGV